MTEEQAREAAAAALTRDGVIGAVAVEVSPGNWTVDVKVENHGFPDRQPPAR